ncbi:MAG: serine hydrolase domain-containing protein, partial [Planctomycetota bacterium]
MISRHPLSVLPGLLVWIGPLLPAAICQDEPTLSDRLAAAVSWWDRPDAPGIAVAVRRGDEVLLRKGLGRASLEFDAPITPETIFHVASVSKQFTAFAVSLLADEGRLSWEDDVREHLPAVPDLGAPISLRQLANHTSGLRDQWELLVLAGWRMDDVITLGHVLDLVARQRELNFPPGSQELYCNTGCTLLAQVVEAVSHRSFPDFCEERIFRPLGMKRSHFHDDHTHIVAGRAYSYAPSPTGFRNSVLSYSLAGATSLFTTVDDLLRWNENFETHRVGSPRVFDWMLERGTLTSGETLDTAKG